MNWVLFWLFLHIAAAIVAFGPSFVFPVLGTMVPQDPAPALPIDPAAAGSAIHDLQVPPQLAPMLDPAKIPSVDTNQLPTAPPQNLDPSYLKDLLKAVQSQGVSTNPALQSGINSLFAPSYAPNTTATNYDAFGASTYGPGGSTLFG